MFFRVLSKIFSLYLFRLGEAVLVGVFKKVLFPQRVASEKVRNVRVPRNYFLFTYSHRERPFGESFSKKFFPQRVDHENAKNIRILKKYFSPQVVEHEKSIFMNDLENLSPIGRHREGPKLNQFKKTIYLSTC